MFAELYHSAFIYISTTSPIQALLVFSFITGFFLFIPSFLVSYYHRKKQKELGLGKQLIIYFVLVFLAWFLVCLVEGLGLGHILDIWELALIGLGIYLPTRFVYNKIMEAWPKLPWMLVQFSLEFLVSILIWYYLIYIARIFGLGVFFQM